MSSRTKRTTTQKEYASVQGTAISFVAVQEPPPVDTTTAAPAVVKEKRVSGRTSVRRQKTLPADRLDLYERIVDGTATPELSEPPPPPPTATETVKTGEKYIEYVPEVYDLFEKQDAVSFQNRVKPLTAPPLPVSTIELVRTHNAMNIYSVVSLYKQGWYQFASLVRGMTFRPESDFFTVQTYQQRYTSHGEPFIGGGDASMSRYGQFGLQVLQTPLATAAAIAPAGGVAAPAGSIPEQQQLYPEERSPQADRPQVSSAAATELQSLEDRLRPGPGRTMPSQPLLTVADQIGAANIEILRLHPELREIKSGTKLQELQARLDNLHREELLRDSTRAEAEATALRRDLRKAVSDNSSWLNDPLQTTGVVVLTPAYVSAKAEALCLIASTTTDTSLANVPESEWVRLRPMRRLPDGRMDTQWETARVMFARLIANIFVKRRMDAGQGIRHKDDKPQIVAEINAILRQIRYTIGYDHRPGYKTFYLVTPRNDERNQYVYQRLSQLRHEPYQSVLGPQYSDVSGGAPSQLRPRDRITTQLLTM